jgi:hypothetical protein
MTDFDQFWAVWPKRKAKKDARKAWKQTEDVRPPIDELIKIVKAHCMTDSWMKDDGEFIPHPGTWLRGERWEDELKIKLPDVVNQRPWHETASGIEAKGEEFGLKPSQFANFQDFRTAVQRAAMKAAA